MLNHLQIQELLKDIKCGNFGVHVKMEGTQPYILVYAPNGFLRVSEEDHSLSRKWPIAPTMTKTEVIWTAFSAIRDAVDQELREHFLFKDTPVFSPHRSLDSLVSYEKDSVDNGED